MADQTITIPNLNWRQIRRVFYVVLATWLIGVRMMDLNPLDDFGDEGSVGLATIMDSLGLAVVYLLSWHVLWPLRPKIS